MARRNVYGLNAGQFAQVKVHYNSLPESNPEKKAMQDSELAHIKGIQDRLLAAGFQKNTHGGVSMSFGSLKPKPLVTAPSPASSNNRSSPSGYTLSPKEQEDAGMQMSDDTGYYVGYCQCSCGACEDGHKHCQGRICMGD